MSCVNINHPEYIKLKQLAIEAGRDSMNFKLDMDLFNKEELRFPTSLEDLDKGIERFQYKSFMHDQIVKIAKINSPAFSNDKKNIFEFRVVKESNKINSYEQAVEVAKKVVNKINEKFNFEGQPNLARLSTSTGIVKVHVEPTTKIIDAFITKQKQSDLQDYMEYSNENENTIDSYYQAVIDFRNLVESGEITQFCSR